MYEGKSVNKSQMDIKRKTCDIRTRKRHLFLDTSSTNIDTLVPLLYQCIETRSIEVFGLFSQPLPHLIGHHLRHSNVLERIYDPTVNSFTRQTLPTVNRKHFFMNILCIAPVCPQKSATKFCFSVVYSSNTVAILTTETSLWTCACAYSAWTVMNLDCVATQWYT
jgi:hypothetical protein